tara:strand:+ start:1141 stop:1599 length:459 start_codon:yes stop_codon:yes gene_type:complete
MQEEQGNSINRYIPDPESYWCHHCKAHSPFRKEITKIGRSTPNYYICADCNKTMFCPSKTRPWMIGLNAVAALAIIIGIVMVVVDDREIKNIGAAGLSLGILFGAVGGMMFYHMRQWNLWSGSQKIKSKKELDHEMAEYLKKSENFLKGNND